MMRKRLWPMAMALCLGMTAFGTPVRAAPPEAAQTEAVPPRTEAAETVPPPAAATGPSAAGDAAREVGQKATKRVALVPVIDRTGGWLTPRGLSLLQDRLDHELHVPLNETMHWVEFLDEDEAKDALGAALEAQGRKPKPELAAREAARALRADLVACLVVDQFYERVFMSWHGFTYIESAAHLTLYGYDAVHDRLIKAPGWRRELSEYHPANGVEGLAVEALDEALREADLRSVVFPLTKKDAGGG